MMTGNLQPHQPDIRVVAASASRSREAGFSLIELLVVIAIVVILGMISYTSVNLIRGEQLRSTTQTLLADLQKCRSDAMSMGPSAGFTNLRGCGFRLPTASSYLLFKFNDSTPASGNYKYDGTSEEVLTTTQTSANVRFAVASANPAGTTVVIFDRFGFPRVAADWTLLTSMNITLTYPGLAVTKCINLDRNSIREGSWNGASCQTL